jgi:hypothetical protein
MVQTVSHEVKSQAIANALLKTHERTLEKNQAVRYLPPHLKSPQYSQTIRPPVHEDFNSFLASSTGQLQTQFLGSAKIATTVQNHRFMPDANNLEKNAPANLLPAATMPKVEAKSPSQMIPLNELAPKLAQLLPAPTMQSIKVQQVVDKGYGPRMANDPLFATAPTDIDKFSLGLIGAVHANLNHQGEFNQESDGEKPQTKTANKPGATTRSEQASVLKREEIEAVREVKEKFQQQLNAQHPHITVPIKHPEGIVDIHLRFDRRANDSSKGAVRVMFSGSNSQVVSLMAQHREDFLKSIIDQGYKIEPAQMQFNHQSPQLSTV